MTLLMRDKENIEKGNLLRSGISQYDRNLFGGVIGDQRPVTETAIISAVSLEGEEYNSWGTAVI